MSLVTAGTVQHGIDVLGSSNDVFEDVRSGKIILKRGMNSDLVSAAQLALGGGIVADGSFGPKTVNAVKAFQTAHGLTPDGQIGKETIAFLSPPTTSSLLSLVDSAPVLAKPSDSYTVAQSKSLGSSSSRLMPLAAAGASTCAAGPSTFWSVMTIVGVLLLFAALVFTFGGGSSPPKKVQ